jgi:hypothetical protein
MDEKDFQDYERIYNEFMDLIYEGHAHKAYGIFKENESIIHSFKLLDIPIIYTEIRNRVGKEEASYFKSTFLKEVYKIVDFSIEDLLSEESEERQFKSFLDTLGDEYKKMLGDMKNKKGI